jgi:hypothetical protein
MHTVLKVLAAGGLVAIGLVAGIGIGTILRPVPPIAQVTFKNESGQAVRDLKLTNTTGGQTNTILLPALNQGESANIQFLLVGEGSYRVEATLADGRQVKGGEGYIESGHRGTRVVRAGEITP